MLHAPGDILDSVAEAHQQRWTHTDEILALVLERLDALINVTERAWFKSAKERKPFRYPRPTQPRRAQPKPATIHEMFRFFRGGH